MASRGRGGTNSTRAAFRCAPSCRIVSTHGRPHPPSLPQLPARPPGVGGGVPRVRPDPGPTPAAGPAHALPGLGPGPGHLRAPRPGPHGPSPGPRDPRGRGGEPRRTGRHRPARLGPATRRARCASLPGLHGACLQLRPPPVGGAVGCALAHCRPGSGADPARLGPGSIPLAPGHRGLGLRDPLPAGGVLVPVHGAPAAHWADTLHGVLRRGPARECPPPPRHLLPGPPGLGVLLPHQPAVHAPG